MAVFIQALDGAGDDELGPGVAADRADGDDLAELRLRMFQGPDRRRRIDVVSDRVEPLLALHPTKGFGQVDPAYAHFDGIGDAIALAELP
jgi:hypothetical protein